MTVVDSHQHQATQANTKTSRGFVEWLAALGGSIVFTTYQAGKVFLIGVKPDGRLSIFERSLARPMGFGVSDDGNAMLLATQFKIYRFDNLLPPGTVSDVHDAAYSLHQSCITGDLHVHDISFGADGTPVLANPLFNCLARTSSGFSFNGAARSYMAAESFMMTCWTKARRAARTALHLRSIWRSSKHAVAR